MKWAEDAEKAVSRVPFFVRKRVKRRVEEEAIRQGAQVVTLHHVQACRKRFLENMENEVRGYQVETCFGPNGCPNRAIITPDITEGLETLLHRKGLRDFLLRKVQGTLKLHHEFRISISDCPNACSRPQIADIGIVGACRPGIADSDCSQCGACVETCREEGIILQPEGPPRIMDSRCVLCGRCAQVCPSGTLVGEERGYRVLLGGKLGRHPQLGRELKGLFPAREMPRIVELCIDHYMKHCREAERFGEVLNRVPFELK
jgi:dissimilatory sulfite reductase (desulfoviridin) alpha/beta subunit